MQMKFVLFLLGLFSCAGGCIGCAGNGCFRFATIGDWGEPQAKVSATMQDYLKSVGEIQAIFALGDNFYSNGVTDVDDKQWQSTFEDVFTDDSVQVPWFAVLGNHDYYQNPDAQVAYTTERNPSGRWTMPARYHAQAFPLCPALPLPTAAAAAGGGPSLADPPGRRLGHHHSGGGNGGGAPAPSPAPEPAPPTPPGPPRPTTAECGTVQVLFLDTVMLDPLEDPRVSLAPGPQQEAMAAEQLAWAEATLAASTADWVFAVGHYPIYSVGSNGNNPRLQDQLLGLFSRYDVDAYFCGHDHLLEHLKDDEGTHYYVSGAGTFVESQFHQAASYDESMLIWADLEYGFTVHSLTKEAMEVSFVNDKGDVVHSYTQLPKRSSNSSPPAASALKVVAVPDEDSTSNIGGGENDGKEGAEEDTEGGAAPPRAWRRSGAATLLVLFGGAEAFVIVAIFKRRQRSLKPQLCLVGNRLRSGLSLFQRASGERRSLMRAAEEVAAAGSIQSQTTA